MATLSGAPCWNFAVNDDDTPRLERRCCINPINITRAGWSLPFLSLRMNQEVAIVGRKDEIHGERSQSEVQRVTTPEIYTLADDGVRRFAGLSGPHCRATII